MVAAPYVVLSCAVSLDGYLDTAPPPRLTLSNPADLDRVDAERAASDAVLVGASTARRDDPRLVVRSAARRDDRRAAGLPATPTKVTVTASGDLDPRAAFFTADADGEPAHRVVCCPRGSAARVHARLDGTGADVVALGREVRMPDVLAALGDRGVERLVVEGGGAVLTQFLAVGIADELQLVVAPLFVGDRRAPRFVGDGAFPWTADRRAALVEARPLGDVALLRYALSSRCPDLDPSALETGVRA